MFEAASRLGTDPEAAGGRGRRGWVNTTLSARGQPEEAPRGDRGAKFPRRLRSREVSHRLPGAGQGAQTALAGLTSSGAQIVNLSKKTPSFAGVSHSPSTATTRHLIPLPSASTTVTKTVEERGGRNLQHNQTAAKKKKGKKFLLLRPIPSTNTENQPPNRQSCNSSQDCGVREGCRVRSAMVIGDPGSRAPQNRFPKAQSFRQQYLRAPPGSPSAGAARLAVSLPQAVSSSAHVCSSSLLPDSAAREDPWEKKCERSHDSFLSAAARSARLAPSPSRSRACRASRAPRFLLSSPCERPQ